MGYAVRGAGQDLSSGAPDSEALCMALEWQRLHSHGLDREMVDTLQASWALSTQLQYSGKWSV